MPKPSISSKPEPPHPRPNRRGQPKTPGSGRPATGKKMVSKRLAADVVAILDQQPDATAYLEAAVREKAARDAQTE